MGSSPHQEDVCKDLERPDIWVTTIFRPQVKQESLGISTKMLLKVDVEGGKLYLKKSKDGPDDKFFVHSKSESGCRILLLPADLFIYLFLAKCWCCSESPLLTVVISRLWVLLRNIGLSWL